jgi:hypothetical protein
MVPLLLGSLYRQRMAIADAGGWFDSANIAVAAASLGAGAAPQGQSRPRQIGVPFGLSVSVRELAIGLI